MPEPSDAPPATSPRIDLRAPPSVPKGRRIVEHAVGEIIEWDPSRIVLKRLDEQTRGVVAGTGVLKGLSSQNTMSANVLDFLCGNTKLIPEGWRDKTVFFWGTIYANDVGRRCVRAICYAPGGKHLLMFDRWLDQIWGPDDYAAILTDLPS